MDGSEWVVELDVSWEGRGRTVDFKVGTGGLGGAPTAPHAELVGGNTLGNEYDRTPPASGLLALGRSEEQLGQETSSEAREAALISGAGK